MTEPLSDETLAEHRKALRQYDESHACYTFELADAVRDLLAEVDSLRAENATLREDNARLVAALETQGEAAFVAGMRAEADVGELAREIAEFASEYLTGEKPDTEAMEEVIGAILKGALEGEQQ